MHHEILARGICVQDGKILLAYLKSKEYYFLPGGHVEHGESALAAFEREIGEELGIEATVGKVALVFEHTWQNKESLVHEINFIITFAVAKDAILTPQVEHLEFKWIPLDDLKTIKFLPVELTEKVIKIAKGEEVGFFKSSMRK